MILNNAIPRLKEAIEYANENRKPKEVPFIYNELLTHDTITAVFEWIFREGIDFATRRDEYRFVIIIQPKK